MKWIVGVVIANTIILNGVMGWVVYKQSSKQLSVISDQLTKTEFVDKCGEECKAEIQRLISNSQITNTQIPTIIPTAVPAKTVTVVVPTKTKVRTVSYVTIPGNGSTALTDWTTLTGTDFYFDTADYPGLTQVTFEANMKLFNGSGRAYLRLLDVTHGIGVQGSDINTNSNSDVIIESGRVSFWAGKNLIRVQAKSATVETAVFNSGRLRLVVEN